jgi:hypothetical protein
MQWPDSPTSSPRESACCFPWHPPTRGNSLVIPSDHTSTSTEAVTPDRPSSLASVSPTSAVESLVSAFTPLHKSAYTTSIRSESTIDLTTSTTRPTHSDSLTSITEATVEIDSPSPLTIRDMPPIDDEYTDYSCSTAIERLARDVETLLRSWHVDGGSDRHISMAHRSPDGSPTHQSTASSTPSTSSSSNHTSSAQTQLIRSDTINWIITLYHPVHGHKISAAIDLALSLWDGPAGNDTSPHTPDWLKSDQGNRQSDLPYSLQRHLVSHMPMDVFLNYSTLFGIGQHLCLTPVNPTAGLSSELLDYLVWMQAPRHVESLLTMSVTTILTQWLQSALNLAIASSQSCFPAFAVWGAYHPTLNPLHRQHIPANQSLWPHWIQTSQTLELPLDDYQEDLRRRLLRKRRVFKNKKKLDYYDHLNASFVAPILTGQLYTPSLEDSISATRATFWCSVLPAPRTASDARLTVWGSVLLQHCAAATVALWGARHVYSWLAVQEDKLLPEQESIPAWRWNENINTRETVSSGKKVIVMLAHEEAQIYRDQCRRIAIRLLEQAAGSNSTDPLWGPPKDPIATLQITTIWNARRNESNDYMPLLMLPLKIRSRRNMTKKDWVEAEETIEESILDPNLPDSTFLQAFFDRESPQTSLAAALRCTLAALIRTATLPRETLISHLVDESLMDRWDYASGNIVAASLATKAQVAPSTLSLVSAMDWQHAAEDLIDKRRAQQIVQACFDCRMSFDYPSPPDNIVSLWTSSTYSSATEKALSEPLLKSAPFGRLLSILCLHMSRVRSPSSMALVWSSFLVEMRRRWDSRESLPNMTYIPGLDPVHDAENSKTCFSSIGVKASFAAHVHSSEPDPDDFNCLIGQKMQVRMIQCNAMRCDEIR